jgi:hypothetical protein
VLLSALLLHSLLELFRVEATLATSATGTSSAAITTGAGATANTTVSAGSAAITSSATSTTGSATSATGANAAATLSLLGLKLIELGLLIGAHAEIGLNVLAEGELHFALATAKLSAKTSLAKSAATSAATLTLAATLAALSTLPCLGSGEGCTHEQSRRQNHFVPHKDQQPPKGGNESFCRMFSAWVISFS